MAITRTIVSPVQGQSPIVLHNVPQSVELVGDITGDKGTNEVWEDTKRIEDFEVKITTLDEYSTGVPHKVVKRVDTLNTTSKEWTEGTRETYEAQEEEFTLSYKGHERDFEVKIDSEESKAFIKYRWGRNDAHDLTVEKSITITERPSTVEPEEGGGSDEADGDTWGYPLADDRNFEMHYRISVPDELKDKALMIKTENIPDFYVYVTSGAELKDRMYVTLADEDEYYASFNPITASGKPSEWWFAYCDEENGGDIVDTDYRVEIPSDEPKLTTETTSVTFDKSKMITPSGTEVPVMVVPFPYKQGYSAYIPEGFYFNETLEIMRAGDFSNIVVGIPCSAFPIFEQSPFVNDCVLYYGKEPTDRSKFHYIFVDVETMKFGYFDDNGDFVEVQMS